MNTRVPRTFLRSRKTPGHLLIDLRSHFRWTVGGLAAKAGLTVRQVETLEDRVHTAKVGAASLGEVAVAYGVTAESLVSYLNGELTLADLLKNRAA